MHRRVSSVPDDSQQTLWRGVPPGGRRSIVRCNTRPERPSGGEPAPGPAPSSSSVPGPSLTDPVQTIAWGGTLPSARRAVLGGLGGVAIALGGNLGGVTSWLLGLDGGRLAGALRADVLVPVRGIKRCVDYSYGFEFTYPTTWLGDQTLVYRAAKRAEQERGSPPRGSRGGDFDDFDDFPRPPSASSSSASPYGRGDGGGYGSDGGALQRRQRVARVEPIAAFGPPGSSGEENVSVIVAPITPGFSLQSLGDPRVAAKRLLAALAPEGSGLTPTLLAAESRTTPGSSASYTASGPTGPSPSEEEQQLYYMLEYTMQGPRFFRHNVSVYTARNDMLYTFNAQCPEAHWVEDAAALQASAASFRLL